MILPIYTTQKRILQNFSSKNSSVSNISFSQKIEENDEFDGYKDCSDNLQMLVYARNNIHLIGTLDNKDYNIRFAQNNKANKKIIDIQGYYDSKRLDIKANYKNNKHHCYKGAYNGQNFEIEYKAGGLFSKDCLKGEINAKPFCAKFPSAATADANRNLMLLLLHFSGYITKENGFNFSVTEPSDFSYAYFNGRVDSRSAGGTLFDDIWKDPVPGPVCV